MNTATKPKLLTHIRWMIRRDMPEVLAIESQSFDIPWTEEDFIKALRNRDVIGMVCEVNERTVGFMVYQLQKHKLFVLNFAVHEDCRYKGVARAMANKLIGKLSRDRRCRIELLIRETNLDAQLCFKALGFRCIKTHREYEITGEDAYEFHYRLDWSQPEPDEPEQGDNPWQDDGGTDALGAV